MEFEEMIGKVKDFGKEHPTYWGCALCGEAGEAANILKKLERDGTADMEALALELADVFLYLVLISRRFGIQLEKAILEKIEIVEARR